MFVHGLLLCVPLEMSQVTFMLQTEQAVLKARKWAALPQLSHAICCYGGLQIK